MHRCEWATSDLMIEYHDREWGVPLHDDRRLFEFLTLEGAQAGLSWETVLKKREAYRLAFDGFDPEIIARYDDRKVAELLANPGIVRNRLKVAAAVRNAQSYLTLLDDFPSFDAYLWQFVGGTPRQNAWVSVHDLPASTPESAALSRELLRRGFKFVGPTICYALMQAVGMVNDHVTDCFRHSEVAVLR